MSSAPSAADYVIVGAGSAGCVLANRLTEDGRLTVLLLEAGGWDRDPLIHIPIGWGRIAQKRVHDWGYDSEPIRGAANRRVDCLRGKVIGGSSSINAMAYVRGHRVDFDRLADKGLHGWSYADVLPYFRKSERWEDGANLFRGGSGPLHTMRSDYEDPLIDAYAEAARSLGYSWVDDYNGPQQGGFSRMQLTVERGRRASTAVSYLRPALRRKNLHVEVHVHVTGLIFDGRRVTGIAYSRGGQTFNAFANREVIVCAGAFNTPQLLMLSGIGNPSTLSAHGIAVRHALAGVGRNLHEHAGTSLVYRRRGKGPFHAYMRVDRAVLGMASAYLFGSGFATRLPGGLTAFVRSTDREPVPDIQLLFLAAPLDAHLYLAPFVRPYVDRFICRVVLLRPESRGEVTLRSASAFAAPMIRQNLLDTESDIRRAVAGLEQFRAIGRAAPVAALVEQEIAPGPECRDTREIESYIRRAVTTSYHPAGTCRMGVADDAHAVVDATLAVHGMANLRVVDASVLPEPIGGNINAAVIMLAERAADLIRGRRPLAPEQSVAADAAPAGMVQA